MRYYEKDGTMIAKNFAIKLDEIDAQVGDCSTVKELISLRRKLYNLKRKHEESGQRYLACEYSIIAINEVIAEVRKENK